MYGYPFVGSCLALAQLVGYAMVLSLESIRPGLTRWLTRSKVYDVFVYAH